MYYLQKLEPGKGSVCCEGSWLQGPCPQPLFYQGHRLPRKLAGQNGLPSRDPDSSALIQVVCVSQLLPVALARRTPIISLGQCWKIDSRKHTATGKWNILCPCKAIFYLYIVWSRHQYTYIVKWKWLFLLLLVSFYCENFDIHKVVGRIIPRIYVYPPLRFNYC